MNTTNFFGRRIIEQYEVRSLPELAALIDDVNMGILERFKTKLIRLLHLSEKEYNKILRTLDDMFDFDTTLNVTIPAIDDYAGTHLDFFISCVQIANTLFKYYLKYLNAKNKYYYSVYKSAKKAISQKRINDYLLVFPIVAYREEETLVLKMGKAVRGWVTYETICWY